MTVEKKPRTEDWTKEIDGMISTGIILVHPNEHVWISEEVWREIGGDPLGLSTLFSQPEILVVPYEQVAEQLTKDGWTRATE
jgi:hypothetical protein